MGRWLIPELLSLSSGVRLLGVSEDPLSFGMTWLRGLPLDTIILHVWLILRLGDPLNFLQQTGPQVVTGPMFWLSPLAPLLLVDLVRVSSDILI